MRAGLITVAAIQLAVYCAWMLSRDEYRYVVLDTTVAMAMLLLLHGGSSTYRKDEASYWTLGGVAVSALAAAIQFYRIAPHVHFNHNDLYHVTQMAAMTLFYRGSKLLRDRSTAAP